MPAPLSLQARALKFLSLREHSRAELARKLRRYSEDTSEIEAVLERLTAKDLLSEPRYAASLVRRHGTKFGRARIERELHAQGLDNALTEQALASLTREQQQAQLQAVWRKKFTPPLDAAARAKQSRFLLARGFDAELVHGWLRQVQSGNWGDAASDE